MIEVYADSFITVLAQDEHASPRFAVLYYPPREYRPSDVSNLSKEDPYTTAENHGSRFV